MVKKLAIGCAGLLLVVMVAGAVGSYFVYRKVKTTITAFTEFSAIPDLERQVRNRTPFAAPASGEFSSDQLERLLNVQERVRGQLGQRFAELEKKYRALSERPDATLLDLPQIVSAYSDLASAYMEAKRAQVEALNEANFSLEEYRWVRNQAYAALGLAIMDIDVARIIEDVKSGETSPSYEPALSGSIGPSGPEQNRTLIQAYQKKLEENVALSFFGL
jgi:hypothetical protein